MIRNIIFDWSGTLVDDLPAVWRATNYVFKQAAVAELTLDQFRAEFCLPFKGFYSRYVPHVALPQLEHWFHSHFREVQHLAREIPHARDMLQYCRDHGLRTILLSTVHRDHFAAQSATTGFDRFLDHVYIEVWDKRTKILEILQTHGLNADETLFVGDMQHDIETARHGGIFSCAVLTGYNRLDQLRAVEPDLIVEHLGELREILARQKFEMRSRPGHGSLELSGLPIVTVGALIFNAAGQTLMIRTQKWSQLWGIPGGKIKFGESSVEALRREITEETGLDVDQIQFVLVQDCIHSKEFYRDAHFVLLNYTCRCRGEPQVRLNDEAQAFRWVPPQDALEMELNQPTRILLETVFRTGSETAPRADDAKAAPGKIFISDLEVFYRIGVPEQERATPQRLLVSAEMTRDVSAAAAADDLAQTIDYYAVTRRLLRFGEGRSWKLLEKLAADIAGFILAEFRPDTVSVTVKKFVISEARHVAVQLIRRRNGGCE